MDHQQAIAILEAFVSDHKRSLIDQVLEQRTRHVTLVFEDIDKPHNVSAVVRTAECMGIQDMHFIKNRNAYSVNPGITQGAAKWVTMHHYKEKDQNNVAACYTGLRKAGYRILATSLHEQSQSIYEVDPHQKTALVFGTEKEGISREAGIQADGLVHIPMAGFTESFNLSVSAAICLTVFKMKLKKWPGLEDTEKMKIKAEWYRRVVREADLILASKGVKV